MQYFRAWIVMSVVWATVSLLLAPLIAAVLRLDENLGVIFFWILLVSATIVPLAHQFIDPRRNNRGIVVGSALTLAIIVSVMMFNGFRTADYGWVPLLWACVLGMSDWLLLKAQPNIHPRTTKAHPKATEDLRESMRQKAHGNMGRMLEAYDANTTEYKQAFLQEQPRNLPYVQLGTVSLAAAKDFLATKYGMEVALASFFIAYQRFYDDPRDSDAYVELRKHISAKTSQVAFADSEEAVTYLSEKDSQRVYQIVNNPRYLNQQDELRLMLATVGIFTGTKFDPPLSDKKDYDTLFLLCRRMLTRMKDCFTK